MTCKNCRATVPLLKTRWLCKKEKKRVVLTMEPNADKTGVISGVQEDVPQAKGSAAQRKEHDKRIAGGTMSHSGVTCPCCGTIMKMEDIRLEGLAGRLGAIMTAVVVDGQQGKEYRLPTEDENRLATEAEKELSRVFAEIPFGLPEEPLPTKETLGFRVPLYGFDKWYKLFSPRQLLALGTFVKYTRAVREVMRRQGYSPEWVEAVKGYLALCLDRVAERNSSICHYDVSRDSISGTFQRYALPISWDFAEAVLTSSTAGSYEGQIDWIALYVSHAIDGFKYAPSPHVRNQSAIRVDGAGADLVITDPPYYDAIPYKVMYRYFVDKGISPLGEETSAFFSRLTSPVVICLQRRANSDISPVHKLLVQRCAKRLSPFNYCLLLSSGIYPQWLNQPRASWAVTVSKPWQMASSSASRVLAPARRK